MNIEEIAIKLNETSQAEKRPFSKIQEIRSKNGLSPNTWSPFSKKSIKDDYAFHSGGRKELQFNFGEDNIEDKNVFRYGVAFSLQPGQSLHNPEAEFKDKIKRFNEFVAMNPLFFEGCQMWHYSENGISDIEVVHMINNKEFKSGNFIFIGKYFESDIDQIDKSDIYGILDLFDYFMPLYDYVQWDVKQQEKRIARLTFNTNGWIMPSGPYGKSRNADSHESRHGYGHEEWLFDTSKIVEGYHYGFLEPVRKQQQAYEGSKYDVWLYTIDSESKKRYYVGDINNVEVIDSETADKIKNIYIKNGWVHEMEEQIKASGANSRGFSNWNGIELFNVRFNTNDINLNDPYYALSSENPVYEMPRYSFSHFKKEFNAEVNIDDNFRFKTSVSETDDSGSPVVSKKHIREPKTVEITYLHNAISKRLTKELKKIYGSANVTAEHPAGYGGNRIDIVVKTSSGLIFYEIKTYTSLKTSIREAIGQLLEYSCWPDKSKAKELIIVTQPHKNVKQVKEYFNHLRIKFNLPIYYQSFDIEIAELSKKI